MVNISSIFIDFNINIKINYNSLAILDEQLWNEIWKENNHKLSMLLFLLNSSFFANLSK